jgi:hypothetical protein
MDVLQQVVSVLLVFALLGAAVWLLRRGGKISIPSFGTRSVARERILGFSRPSRSMVPVERLALTPQHTLHIVRINGSEVLLATHPQGCSVVTTATERAMGAGA